VHHRLSQPPAHALSLSHLLHVMSSIFTINLTFQHHYLPVSLEDPQRSHIRWHCGRRSATLFLYTLSPWWVSEGCVCIVFTTNGNLSFKEYRSSKDNVLFPGVERNPFIFVHLTRKHEVDINKGNGSVGSNNTRVSQVQLRPLNNALNYETILDSTPRPLDRLSAYQSV